MAAKSTTEQVVTVKKTSDEVAALLDVVKDVLASMADIVYQAQKDGHVTWVESLQIASMGVSKSAILIDAFKRLAREDTEQLIDVLKTSDIVIK